MILFALSSYVRYLRWQKVKNPAVCFFRTTLLVQEIQRVLKPGGKFFYMEHILAKEGNMLRTI